MIALPRLLIILGAFNVCHGQSFENDDEVEEPCYVKDINCIRRYFENNACCTKVDDESTMPENFEQPISSYYFPSINMSLSQQNNTITGLKGKVSRFFVNPNTGNTVLSISFTSHIVDTDEDTFTYYLKGSEPVTATCSSREEFSSFEATTTFPNDELVLSESLTFGYLDEVPKLALFNPLENEQPDRRIQYMFSQLRSHYDVFVRESFIARARYYTKLFIQTTICDFKDDSSNGPESNPVYNL